MSERRPMGALENEVLSVLWASDGPMNPAEVREALVDPPAYTTVMTILSRLWEKGIVTRSRVGRAYSYRPKVSEAELAARRMRAHLDRAGDRAAVLSRFIDTLTRRDERTLRKILEELDGA